VLFIIHVSLLMHTVDGGNDRVTYFPLVAHRALPSHENFDAQLNASLELVSLFRSMWFLCSLLHFAIFEEKDQIAVSWVRPVLGKVASKTPAIVVKEVIDLVGELEYNTVMRREYAHAVSPYTSYYTA